nr:hypothetical protein 18 [bacterium]
MLAGAIIFAIAVCLIMGQGCATSKVGKAYDVIYTAAVTHDTLLKFAADQYAEGRLTEDQKDKVVDLSRKYQAAIRVAQGALKVYKLAEIRGDQGDMDKGQKALAVAVDAMNEARDLFADYINNPG